ncbi:unnamed protein product [Amoebophrya sp. A120]|nr:unnamed protein product [Amoebophrya sp. A120]|eukprot:GSA120T00001362001.1
MTATMTTALWNDKLYQTLVARPTGRQRLTQALRNQKSLTQPVRKEMVLEMTQKWVDTQPELSVTEWLKGIGLGGDDALLERAAEQYDNKMEFLLQDEFPAVLAVEEDPEKLQEENFDGWATLELSEDVFSKVRILHGIEQIRRNGLASEATRIRLQRKLDDIEERQTLKYGNPQGKTQKVGRRYLGGNSTLRTNPIQEFLESVDNRVATKYVRVLSRAFAYLEDVDETAIFFLEHAGCKVLAWERMALLQAIRDYRASRRK